jgi:transmembrane sensor
MLSLKSNSQVKVSDTPSKRIINLLCGEAHFDVAHDAQRLFEVYSGRRMVKALGTAFSVYPLADSLKVLVTQGIVEVAIVNTILLFTPNIQPLDTLALSDSSDHTGRALTPKVT